MVKIIAICNQKGGTGKTTTAVNLATAVAKAGKKVLLIDIDPQANATSGAGIDKTKVYKSIYDVLIEESPIKDVLMSNSQEKMSNSQEKMSNSQEKMSNSQEKMSNSQREMSNSEGEMSILPSNSHLAGAEIELVAVLSREYRLKKALENIKNDFDYIFIDCPPSLGLLTLNALTAANSVIIPVQCEYYALEGLTQLLSTITLVQDNLNSSLTIEGVLMTMADYRTNLTQEVIAEVRNYFKEKVYHAVIPRNIRLSEAPSFGKSIFSYDKDSIGAKKYLELACEILGIYNSQHIENKEVKLVKSEQSESSLVCQNIEDQKPLNETAARIQ